MSGWIGGGLLCLVLLTAVILCCPVFYEAEMGEGGARGRLRFLGGLIQKTFSWDVSDAAPPEEEEMEDASLAGGGERPGETERSAPIPPESPMPLFREGEPAGEMRREEPQEGSGAGEAAGRSWPDVLTYAWDNGALSVVLHTAGALVRHSWPTEIRLTGRIGLSDPMKTGLMAGACAAALPGVCRVDWQYTEPVMAARLTMKGFVVPACLLYMTARCLMAGPVRRAMAYRRGDLDI